MTGKNARQFLRSVSAKMILWMVFLILPVNLLAIGLSSATIKSAEKQVGSSIQYLLEESAEDLKVRMNNAEYYLWNLKTQDSRIIEMSRQLDNNAYKRARARVVNVLKDNISLINGSDAIFFVFPKTEDMLVYDRENVHLDETKQFVTSLLEKKEYAWKEAEFQGRPVLGLLIDLAPIQYGGWIYLDTITKGLEKNLSYKNLKIYFSEEEQKPVEDEYLFSVYLKKIKTYLYCSIPREELLGNISSIYGWMRSAAVFTFALFPVLYFVIQKIMIHPLRILNQAHRVLRNGDVEYRITEKANSSDYEEAFRAFNEMAENIKTLRIANYEKELARKQMEVKNLQLQIHPHFLLNTFNLIYNLAQRHEDRAVQKIILYLSDYFRYLFRSGQETEIFTKEQQLIEEYLEMAKVRYPGRIEVEYEYDPELVFVRVPPLLIHNFVENIIKYALEKTDKIHISLVGQYADSVVTFMIMDDGAGMTDEEVEELDRLMRSGNMNGDHVGFVNSYLRLKHCYGESADIRISSEKGEGTCITVLFPCNLEVSD